PQSRLHQDEGEKEEKDLVFTAIVILMIYVQHNTFNLRKSVALDG
ncbi:6731_t:CDS:1, partial [Rhizophagus irregularis]